MIKSSAIVVLVSMQLTYPRPHYFDDEKHDSSDATESFHSRCTKQTSSGRTIQRKTPTTMTPPGFYHIFIWPRCHWFGSWSGTTYKWPLIFPYRALSCTNRDRFGLHFYHPHCQLDDFLAFASSSKVVPAPLWATFQQMSKGSVVQRAIFSLVLSNGVIF
jgi:hypothetical protein